MTTIHEDLDREFAPAWKAQPGDKLVGIVTDVSVRDGTYGEYPIITVRSEDGELAVHAFHEVLQGELARIAPKVGDHTVLPLNDKVPLAGSNGSLGATADPGAVALWPTGVNVGIATGNGLVVMDIDYRHDGGDSLAELERRHGQLPKTASVETGGGGDHLYFRTSAKVRNSAGKLGPGLDVRGEGGYVVAPPSIHPESGRRYVWDNHPGDVELAPLPGWLGELLLEQQQNGRARAVSEWRRLAANGVTEGARNHSVAQLAGHLLGRGVDPYVALELVLAWNRTLNRPPLGDGEVARTVDSIAKREAAKWTG